MRRTHCRGNWRRQMWNCRLLPDDSVERVVAELTKLVNDEQVKISVATNEGASPVSPLRDDIMKAFTRITDTMWPGVLTVPSMAVGGTDGRYLRSAGDSYLWGTGFLSGSG
ncbi:MAG: hypothetical protein QM757_16260 [Paludibaculum sp.]